MSKYSALSAVVSPAVVLATSMVTANAENLPESTNRILLDKTTYEALDDANKAYIQGVLEVAKGPILFVDPDKIDPNNDTLAGRQLRTQLESQVVGSADALKLRAENVANFVLEIDNANIPLTQFARDFQRLGPLAISGVEVNGQVYGVVNLLPDIMDEKDEIVRIMSSGLAKPENVEANINDLARAIGQHEGSHTNRIDYGDPHSTDMEDDIAGLQEEVKADSDITGQLTEEWQDLRHLSSGFYYYNGVVYKHDTEHSTGLALDHGNASKIDVLAVSRYREKMDQYVESKLSDKDQRSANEVLEQEPELFFKLATEGSEQAIQSAKDKYFDQGEKFQDLEAVVVAEAEADYRESFEGAYRRLNLGQDVPDTVPSNLSQSGFYIVYQDELQSGKGGDNVVKGDHCKEYGRITSTNGLNMREDADQNSIVLPVDDNGKSAAINFGDIVQIHDKELSPLGTQWKGVSSPDGRLGYVSGRFVEPHHVECTPKPIIKIPDIKF